MNLQEIRRKITETSAPILEGRNAFLVDLQVRPDRKAVLIQLFVDTDQGITIQQCAEINRDLASTIQGGGLPEGAEYRLEVSSPGIDRPLKLLRQYRKNIGRKFLVRFSRAGEQGSLSGILASVDEDRLTFQPENGESISLPFDTIIESKEELPW
ncbi:MAG TPA: ribosome maturation factor RimP [Bacteroidota bacterium]